MQKNVNDSSLVWRWLAFGTRCLLALFALSLVVMIGGWAFYRMQVNKYTSDSQRRLPFATVRTADLARIKNKFNKANFKQQEVEEIILTEEELNQLIASDERLRGKVALNIRKPLLFAQVSLPVDRLPGAQGRFFNGELAVRVSIEEGKLQANVVDAKAKGESLPEFILDEIRAINLFEKVGVSNKLRSYADRVRSLSIEDDQLRIELKKGALH